MKTRSGSSLSSILRASVACALVVPVFACGGDSEPTDDDLLEASLVRLDDFPEDDWKVDQSAAADNADSKQFDADIDKCEAEGDPTLDQGFPESESEDFVRGSVTRDDWASAGSSSKVVDDAEVRDNFIAAVDPLVNCVGDAVARYFNKISPVPVDVAAPYAFTVESASDAVEARTLQLGLENGQLFGNGEPTMFADIVATETGPTLSVAIFIHFGSLTTDEEAAIVEAGVKRTRDLTS